ncbi:RNA polymerase, sigma-24 subunit, ECF subfamily [Pedosphaera parvula Ellin514]|uniref:RNA polymerase, sigma-24 subunit, ECF subfamily n=2 Tax=Pedosphaera TaxID=1032526 RepID=B9XLL1_PEDPL|nr:RNA polymerase, sigma-24 subunit, ECF subfamily [Pedosphaera parvula Ellin514]
MLRRFADENSSEAFAELVRRHIPLVYSTALRQLNGDSGLAQDVTQSVFIDLARKASGLKNRVSITGWLYTSTHYAAAKAVRGESRRREREQEAHRMQELSKSESEVDWSATSRVLDELMHQLKEGDREAILLRYFEDRPFAEVGTSLGVSENAARMRVERALEKLRNLLTGRGIVLTGTALAAGLASQSTSAVPAGLAKAVIESSSALMANQTGMGTIISKIMSVSKVKLGVSALVGVGLVAGFVGQQRSLARLSTENAAMQQENRKLASLAEQKLKVSTNVSPDMAELERLRGEHRELLRLRGEVTRLQASVGSLSNRVANTKNTYGLLPDQMPPIRSPNPAPDAWAYSQLVKKLVSGKISPAEEYHLAKAWPYLGKSVAEPDQFAHFQSSYLASLLDIKDKDTIWRMRQILEQARDEERFKGLSWIRAYDDGLMGDTQPAQTADPEKVAQTRERWKALDQRTLQQLSDVLPPETQQVLAGSVTGVLDFDARLRPNPDRMPDNAKFQELTPQEIYKAWPMPPGTRLQTVVKKLQ